MPAFPKSVRFLRPLLLTFSLGAAGCGSTVTPTTVTQTPVATVSYTAPTAPCVAASNYGTPAVQAALDQDAELSINAANQATYVVAVQAGMNSRGNTVGCPGTAYTYEAAAATAPTYAQALSNWTGTHVPGILSYPTACPDLGRTGAGYALAGYYANLSAYTLSTFTQQQLTTKLTAIDNMLAGEQFTSGTVSGTVTNPGSFGYLNTSPSNSCFFTTLAGSVTLGSNIDSFCTGLPNSCATYTAGLFKGLNFQEQDLGDLSLVPDGSMDFDHGFDGVALMEATIQQANSPYANNLALAGQWAINEPAVRDVNYTAKLVWLLAELYDRTGNTAYSTAMMNKLNRGLLINALMPDPANPANVYGMSPAMPFAALTPVAQTPGRMFDGHNALPDYSAINTWSLVEAYVALRDQGDTGNAATVRPYAIAAMNNLAYEVNTFGVPSLGKSQIPMTLLLGLWKISAYEGFQGGGSGATNWESAAWRCWNNGAASNFGPETLNAALYLVYLSNKLYEPLESR